MATYKRAGVLSTLWEVMSLEKGDLVERCEAYAAYTLPDICPQEGSEGEELRKASVVIGPRLVNHLANRIVDTMFPHDKAFFTLKLTTEAERALDEEYGEEGAGKMKEMVRDSTARVEKVAMRSLRMTAYRPRAVEATQHMIITGNALIFRQDDGTRLVYGVQSYCIRRRLDGEPYEVITCDSKMVSALDLDLQLSLKEANAASKGTDKVNLYTHWLLVDGRWAVAQAIDNIDIIEERHVSIDDFPLLPLTWALGRGQNYGRGLVEENVVGFHSLDVATEALQDTIGIIADLKFLVKTSSVVDVAAMNKAPRGSYHAGNEGDVTSVDVGKSRDAAIILQTLEKWERGLAQAFLLNSSGVRDAERVTAEEIRLWARELESAYGGLYSRLALDWQQHESEFAIAQIDFNAVLGASVSDMFEVLVVTGLESLSREGQLDAVRLAVADLQMLDAVPEELRSTINPLLFASFIFTNRGVDMKQFMYTQQEMQANQQAAADQQAALMQQETQNTVAAEAGKAAVNQP